MKRGAEAAEAAEAARNVLVVLVGRALKAALRVQGCGSFYFNLVDYDYQVGGI